MVKGVSVEVESEKLPFVSDIVPIILSFTTMFTPTKGSPVDESIIEPEIVVCAVATIERNRQVMPTRIDRYIKQMYQNEKRY